ncbi:MAG: MBL fold metallo-hydrolase [Balneola sp.]|jgi:phosphoribosyl 1,2-cyclic phosphate phosphodiesterase|nr:MBL fold metallo-hydrolase [Balneola sp.]MBE77765.1 MBL fold metallo-hydrolase [Balneola sp.]HBX65645.1 MBL fold metallo-hydrolase [Balneolaceae bacterium]|tara:strand:+ start:636 stop:1400 length:765 start_codon:yes stop_codon:yes gene_type:complete
MKITFLGTGTSMGVPVAGGFRREKLAHDPRNERTRCSVWIQVNGKSILIDAGPEFRIQSIRARIKKVDHFLITHEHMDHISGIDDLRVYSYINDAPIPSYSSAQCIRSIEKRFDYMFGDDKYPGSTSLDLKEVSAPFVLDGVDITPLPVKHGSLDILGFRVNDFSYLTDVKHIPEETLQKIKGSKVIALSALRWEPQHPTHLTIPEAVEVLEELDIPEAYLIHMNSYVDHEPTNKRLPEHINLAYDQLSIEIPD